MGHWMLRRAAYVAVLGSAMLTAVPMSATQAVWTDSAEVTDNLFVTGSVDLATSQTTALVAFDGMVPGDEAVAPISIDNSGTIDFRYSLTTLIEGSTSLAAGLDLTIKSGVLECTSESMDLTGTVVFDASLASGGFGDPAEGEQTGDRNLVASASESLCFRVALPSEASNDLQGLTTAATFSFHAEQV